jgi:putative tryptophan/tyrosine transport system substrate-binding protein
LAADPVQLGLVASLNRPGGNITGVTLMTNSLEAKRLELLHKMVPTAKSVAILANPANQSNEEQVHRLREAVRAAPLNLIVFTASNGHELAASFVSMSEYKVDALTVLSDVFFTSNSAHIAALSADHQIPAIAHSREFPIAGGLMSYGTNLADAYRLAGTYAGRILRGEAGGAAGD